MRDIGSLLTFAFSLAFSPIAYAAVGDLDEVGAFPFVVIIQAPTSYCTGIAHTSGIVSTAAHCVSKDGKFTSGLRIVFKDVDKVEHSVKVRKALIPPEYADAEALANNKGGQASVKATLYDIAYLVPDGLVQTAGYARFIEDILPSSLVDELSNIQWRCSDETERCTSEGFTRATKDRVARVLSAQIADMPRPRIIVTGAGDSECKDYEKREETCTGDKRIRVVDVADISLINPKRECARESDEICLSYGSPPMPWVWITGRSNFGLQSGIDPVLHGDSGGPIFFQAKDRTWICVGYVSRGNSNHEFYSSALSNLRLLREVLAEPKWRPADGGWGGSPRYRPAQIYSSILEFFDNWSAENEVALDALRKFYGPSVNYGGKQLNVDQIIANKRQFAEKYPQRQFGVRGDSLVFSCPGGETTPCTMKVDVQWLIWPRDSDGSGLAGVSNYQFLISPPNRFGQKLPIILSEDGQVVARYGHECPFCQETDNRHFQSPYAKP